MRIFFPQMQLGMHSKESFPETSIAYVNEGRKWAVGSWKMRTQVANYDEPWFAPKRSLLVDWSPSLLSMQQEHAAFPWWCRAWHALGVPLKLQCQVNKSFVFARWPIRVPVFTRNCALFFWFPCGFIINTYCTVWSQFDTQLEYAERVDRIGTSSSAIPAAWLRGFCFKMVLDSSICHTNGAFWHCHGWTGRRDARDYENDMKRV